MHFMNRYYVHSKHLNHLLIIYLIGLCVFANFRWLKLTQQSFSTIARSSQPNKIMHKHNLKEYYTFKFYQALVHQLLMIIMCIWKVYEAKSSLLRWQTLDFLLLLSLILVAVEKKKAWKLSLYTYPRYKFNIINKV